MMDFFSLVFLALVSWFFAAFTYLGIIMIIEVVFNESVGENVWLHRSCKLIGIITFLYYFKLSFEKIY